MRLVVRPLRDGKRSPYSRFTTYVLRPCLSDTFRKKESQRESGGRISWQSFSAPICTFWLNVKPKSSRTTPRRPATVRSSSAVCPIGRPSGSYIAPTIQMSYCNYGKKYREIFILSGKLITQRRLFQGTGDTPSLEKSYTQLVLGNDNKWTAQELQDRAIIVANILFVVDNRTAINRAKILFSGNKLKIIALPLKSVKRRSKSKGALTGVDRCRSAKFTRCSGTYNTR